MEFHQVPTTTSIECIKTANTADLVALYKRLKIKFAKVNEHLWFNSTCKRHNLIPKYITNNIKTSSSRYYCTNLLNNLKQNWLNNELRFWYCQRNNLSSHIKVIHMELHKRLSNVELDLLLSYTQEITKELSGKIHKTHLKKFNSLNKFKSSNPSAHTGNGYDKKFYKRVYNTTGVTFTENEMSLLEKGPKYCPKFENKIKDLENLAVDLDTTISDVTTKHLVAEKIKQHYNTRGPTHSKGKSCNEWLTLETIKSKLIDNNLVVTKADKGNTLVIAERQEYDNKIKDFLNSGPFDILQMDPTKKYNDLVRNTLKSANSILTTADSYLLREMNPKTPRLYGYYKLHKSGKPIRPVVSYTEAPTYRLAAKINKVYKTLTRFEPKHVIKNSLDLINKIKNITIPPNGTIVSFDVKNLFPSIPTKECKEALYNIMVESKLEPQVIIDLAHCLEICLSQNYFIYNNTVYKQQEGLAMGSPLSPLCADVFMDGLEKLIHSNHKYCDYLLYWYRYVDDIICLWTGPRTELDEFLSFINSLNSSIQFTMEVGVHRLNFLDLNIDISRGKHDFKIHRKDTYSDNIIPADSYHPISHKHAALQSMVHRLLTVPLSKRNYLEELENIKIIAINNGYSAQLINTMVKNKLKKRVGSLLYSINGQGDINRQTFARLPFLGNISYKCSRLLKERKAVYYSTKSLGNVLFNIKQKIPRLANSGVYKLQCQDCESVYVGQTGRSFTTRVSEHVRSWRSGKRDSAFARHLLDENHTFDPTNVKTIHICCKSRKLDSLEALEINKLKNSPYLLNDKIDLNNSPLLNLFS